MDLFQMTIQGILNASFSVFLLKGCWPFAKGRYRWLKSRFQLWQKSTPSSYFAGVLFWSFTIASLKLPPGCCDLNAKNTLHALLPTSFHSRLDSQNKQNEKPDFLNLGDLEKPTEVKPFVALVIPVGANKSVIFILAIKDNRIRD